MHAITYIDAVNLDGALTRACSMDETIPDAEDTTIQTAAVRSLSRHWGITSGEVRLALTGSAESADMRRREYLATCADARTAAVRVEVSRSPRA